MSDPAEHNLKLLAANDLEEVMEIIGQFAVSASPAEAVAIMIWDPDLEDFSDRECFGAKKKQLAGVVQELTESFRDTLPDAASQKFQEVDEDELDSAVPKELSPLCVYPLYYEKELCACLLIAGVEESQLAALCQDLSHMSCSLVITHAWEYRELSRENQRLRTRYEELEDRIVSMEEQTRKLIHDVMAKDALRTKHTERERLVYGISNTVRSSLEIESVLQRAVDNIGSTYQVSRCLVLRLEKVPETVEIYEYHSSGISSIREHFVSADGLHFVRAASSKQAPQYLADPNETVQGDFDLEFLKQLDYRSGLIVPLIMRDQSLGVLLLQDAIVPREWDIDDLSLLGALADQLSVGIENAQLHAEKKQQAVMDELTGVANRRRFMEVYHLEFERAKRYSENLSLVVFDLDFLKKINDTHGHQAGDAAIRSIGKLLKQSSRAVDLPARYGGEEFCLLLPNTDLAMAAQIAERARKLINETPVEGLGPISASVGVACYPQHADEPESLFERADEALYEAKRTGRNRVCLAGAVSLEYISQDSGSQGTGAPGGESTSSAKPI
jgi:diguanylate cyclase (GGDEF)-like protein